MDQLFTQNRDKKTITPTYVLVYIVLWYAFLGSSTNILRPSATYVWVALAVGGILMQFRVHVKLSVYTLLFTLSLATMLTSYLYSHNASETLSLCIKYLIFFVIGSCIGTKRNLRHLVVKISVVFLIAHMVLLYLQVLLPAVFTRIILPLIPESAQALVMIRIYRGDGIGFTTQTGVAGFWMAMGLGFVICKICAMPQSRKKFDFLLCLLFAVACILTRKRSFTLISLLLILLMVYISSEKRGRLIKSVLSLFGLLFISYLIVTIFPNLNGVVEKTIYYLDSNDLLNGRTYIYQNALSIFSNYKWFGIGFGAFRSIYSNLWGVSIDVHNSYLQSLVELGLVGCIPFWLPYLYGYISTCKAVSLHKIKSRNAIDRFTLYFSFYIQTLIFLWGLSGNPFVDDTFLFFFILMQTSTVSILRERIQY